MVRPGSEEIVAPFNAQERTRGSSPLRTMQSNWANSPSSSTSLAKLNGTKLGGSKMKKCVVAILIGQSNIDKLISLILFQHIQAYLNLLTATSRILPLTFKVAVCDVTPALFLAVQVYVPLCL